MNKEAKRIIVLTVVGIFGITTLAFAGWGCGHGHMMGGGDRGMGYHHIGG
jgi:hypothetical protein